MTLYIQIDDQNKPINNPLEEFNLKQLFPEHDFSIGSPSGYVEFERVPPPILSTYQKFDETKGADICLAFSHNGLEYKFIDGKVKDVWHVIDMTDDEKKAAQDLEKAKYNNGDIPSSWIFNESTCQYEPPTPMPTDGKGYIWDEYTTSWKEINQIEN